MHVASIIFFFFSHWGMNFLLVGSGVFINWGLWHVWAAEMVVKQQAWSILIRLALQIFNAAFHAFVSRGVSVLVITFCSYMTHDSFQIGHFTFCCFFCLIETAYILMLNLRWPCLLTSRELSLEWWTLRLFSTNELTQNVRKVSGITKAWQNGAFLLFGYFAGMKLWSNYI